MTAVTLTFFALFSLATFKVGIGLSKRFDAMDVYKLTSYVVAIGGIIGLVIYLTATNAPDMGIQTLLWINSVVLYRRSGLVAPVIDCRSGTHRFRIGVRHDDGAARFEVGGKGGSRMMAGRFFAALENDVEGVHARCIGAHERRRVRSESLRACLGCAR